MKQTNETAAPRQRGTTHRKNQLMATTILVGLALSVVWCYGRLTDNRDAAGAAAADLAACRESATRVEALRRRPAVAGTRELGETTVRRRIEQAASAAGFPGGITGIVAEPGARVGETAYREKPTAVRFLRPVTLEQLFTFFHALAADGPAGAGLRVKSVRLTAPRGEETGDKWAVESTLTYLVYDPKTENASASGGRRGEEQGGGR